MMRSGALLGLVLVLATGCVHAPQSTPLVAGPQVPGSLASAELIRKDSATFLRFVQWWVEVPEPAEIDYGMRSYRLEYWTTNFDGQVVKASGLVSLPKGDAPLRGVVSYQHGTSSNREDSPSSKGLGEGALISAIFAGGGYVLVAADYIGLGTNHGVHPYMHAATTASTSIDLLRAAKTFVESQEKRWPGELYLVGFSQGGHATLAVQRALEAAPVERMHVVSSTPIAGPVDLPGISFPVALEGKSTSHTFYLAYVACAYSAIYGQPVTTLLAEPYASSLPGLFDGDHGDADFAAALPKTPRELFTPEFLDAFDHGKSHWFLDALQENSLLDWKPAAPIRLYFGDKDLDVSPREAQLAFDTFSKAGCNVTLVPVGPYAHDESVMYAIPLVRKHFDNLSLDRAAR